MSGWRTVVDAVLIALAAVAALLANWSFSYLPGVTSPKWSAQGAEVRRVEATLPDGSKGIVLRVRSTSDDGVLSLRFVAPAGQLNWSVYLRSDQGAKANLYLVADNWELGAARGSTEWRRFSLTQALIAPKRIAVQIGGGRSFTVGEEFDVWAPMLTSGVQAPSPREVSHAEWMLSQGAARIPDGGLAGVSLVALLILGIRHKNILGRPRIRAALSYAVVLALSWAGLEGACFAVLTMKRPAAQVLAAAKVIWTAEPTLAPKNMDLSTTFSPLTQVRRTPGAMLGPYDINRLGLIDNESDDPLLHTMPEKPARVLRVVLYGGSTAMGIGAPDGSKTIAAQLEQMLNDRAKGDTRFQVLNFGHGGGQSYTDLMFMVSAGAHLEADAHVALTGFNDAFFATQASGVFGNRPYVANWADFSYHYHDAINGLSGQQGIRLRFLPFSSLLANDLARGDGNAKAVAAAYGDMPARLITELVDGTEGRDSLLKANLRFAAGAFTTRPDQLYLCYLQPHPLQFRVLQEPTEKELTLSSIQRLVPVPLDEYSRRMVAMFDAYGRRFQELQGEYSNYGNIRFTDIRHLFENFDQPAYIDIIHYTPQGQRRIAERILEDLAKAPKFAPHLKAD